MEASFTTSRHHASSLAIRFNTECCVENPSVAPPARGGLDAGGPDPAPAPAPSPPHAPVASPPDVAGTGAHATASRESKAAAACAGVIECDTSVAKSASYCFDALAASSASSLSCTHEHAHTTLSSEGHLCARRHAKVTDGRSEGRNKSMNDVSIQSFNSHTQAP